jgi:hypothetical protein
LDGRQNLVFGRVDEASDEVARTVTGTDLVQATLGVDAIAAGAVGHVAEAQGVGVLGSRRRELSTETRFHAAQGRLEPRARVVGNEVDGPLIDAKSSQVSAAVDRVESRLIELGGVSDVVKPGGGHEERSVQACCGRDLSCAARDGLNMPPASAQWLDQPMGLAAGPLDRELLLCH